MIFVTGATGYLGSYVLARLLNGSDEPLAVLVRAPDNERAADKLWRALQLHLSATDFEQAIGAHASSPRIQFVLGDLTAPLLGMEPKRHEQLSERCSSVIHIAASLNRRSEKACLNTNLRGTLAVIKFAQRAVEQGGLRRFSHVSTVAVAGERERECVFEDQAIDWSRADYDPYGRTKKFCEHMVRELLPDTPKTFFRPSMVIGDSRFPETTQFDMVRAFCWLADLPAVPLRKDARLDIVNVDYVTDAIVDLHLKERTAHEVYHLSSGTLSETAQAVSAQLSRAAGVRPPRFAPVLQTPFQRTVDALSALRLKGGAGQISSLLKVFLPYITYDTVFDNQRVVSELGRRPVPFTNYCADLYRWANAVRFRYPYRPRAPQAVKRAA